MVTVRAKVSCLPARWVPRGVWVWSGAVSDVTAQLPFFSKCFARSFALASHQKVTSLSQNSFEEEEEGRRGEGEGVFPKA